MNLPDNIVEQLSVCADEFEAYWRNVAEIAIYAENAAVAAGIKRNAVYENIGAVLGMRPADVRRWVKIHKATKDMQAEYPHFRFWHWELMVKGDLAEEAARWSETMDHYAGLPPPPHVMDQKQAGEKPDPDEVRRKHIANATANLERAEQLGHSDVVMSCIVRLMESEKK